MTEKKKVENTGSSGSKEVNTVMKAVQAIFDPAQKKAAKILSRQMMESWKRRDMLRDVCHRAQCTTAKQASEMTEACVQAELAALDLEREVYKQLVTNKEEIRQQGEVTSTRVSILMISPWMFAEVTVDTSKAPLPVVPFKEIPAAA